MKNEDFELLKKMYDELQSEIKSIKAEMQTGFKEIKQDIAGLGNKMDDNHKIIYDGYGRDIESIH